VRTPIVIADEISAAGFRIAGARTLVPTPGALGAAFESACTECELLLMSATLARELPRERLAAALVSARPLLLVFPDAFGGSEPPDLMRELERALGVAT
jgi:vacuolar-type H+-ATPase subunit F/Vma7